jgi:hypothetical protein
MRKTLVVLVAAMMVGMTIPAFAELQNVQVGGSLRIRGNWYSENDLDFNNDINEVDALYVEQRTKINVSADFTDDVHAFIELDSYDVFGDEFRGLDDAFSLYNQGNRGGFSGFGASALSGVDSSGSSGTSVSFYQGYVEMREAWGYPITIKIGRSEMQHGDEFLVGNNDTNSNFRGLSFDGAWLTYNHEKFNITGFWTRLITNNDPFRWESSGDVNFSGIYGSYTGIENMTIDGYYYYYHQALVDGTSSLGFTEASAFSTIGARFAGNRSQFDWSANAAYQFGDSGVEGIDVNAFAMQGALGYTFDVNMQPRVFLNGAYYTGADDSVIAGSGSGDLAFNRLFSDHEYSQFLDSTDLSNVWFVGGGVSAQVTESIGLTGVVNWLNTVENYEDIGGPSDNNLGVEVGLYAKYDYSEDLYFKAGYAHLFAGDAMEGGVVVSASGLGFVGGFGESDDIDYVFVETGIKF